MLEPLSVAASIVGILAAAGKVIEVLGPLISSVKDPSPIVVTIHAEVNSSRGILSALRLFLDDLDRAPLRRRELITVDHVRATLADGALVFNELQAIVAQLSGPPVLWRTRLQLSRKRGTLNALISRLHLFKTTINVMLTILQCETDQEAKNFHAELHHLMSELLETNRSLAQRLPMLEFRSQCDGESLHSIGTIGREAMARNMTGIRIFGFERDLEGSWVYRKARRSTADVSFNSSTALSHAWTALSDLSLSDISNISVIALPLLASDFGKNGWRRVPKAESHLPVSGKYTQTDIALEIERASPHKPSRAPSRAPSLVVETERGHNSNLTVFNPGLGDLDVSWPFAPRKRQKAYDVVVLCGEGVNKVRIHHQLRLDPSKKTPESRVYGIGGQAYTLNMMGSPTAEQYPTLRAQYIRAAQGIVIAYSVTDRPSYLEARWIVLQAFRAKHEFGPPIFLVADTCDTKDREREVSNDEGFSHATRFGCHFMEVSTSESTNFSELFRLLILKIHENEELRQQRIRKPQSRKRPRSQVTLQELPEI